MSAQVQPIFYVINLAEDKDRLAWMNSQSLSLGFESQLIVTKGINGNALSDAEILANYDSKQALSRTGREFTRGEIGCALSHLKAAQQLVHSSAPWAFILEDDTELSPDIPYMAPNFDRWLNHAAPRIVSLSPVRKFRLRNKESLVADFSLVKPIRAWGALCYGINQSAAKILLTENSPIRLCADDWVGFNRYLKIDVRGVDPFLAKLRTAPSDSHIEADRARVRRHKSSKFRLKMMAERVTMAPWRYVLEPIVYGIGEHDSSDNFSNYFLDTKQN